MVNLSIVLDRKVHGVARLLFFYRLKGFRLIAGNSYVRKLTVRNERMNLSTLYGLDITLDQLVELRGDPVRPNAFLFLRRNNALFTI